MSKIKPAEGDAIMEDQLVSTRLGPSVNFINPCSKHFFNINKTYCSSDEPVDMSLIVEVITSNYRQIWHPD